MAPPLPPGWRWVSEADIPRPAQLPVIILVSIAVGLAVGLLGGFLGLFLERLL